MGKNVKERAGWPCLCCFATHHGGVFQTLIASCLNYFNSFLTGPLPPFSPPSILCSLDNVIFLLSSSDQMASYGILLWLPHACRMTLALQHAVQGFP